MTDVRPENFDTWAEAMDAFEVPQPFASSITSYIVRGLRPGGFTTACLSNDLSGAVLHAHDPVAFNAIPAIVKLLHNEAPGPSWGSPEKVEAWLVKIRADIAALRDVSR